MRLIFIRHAEPDYEHDSLTEKGWREAKLLAARTKDWYVDDFYVSPLGRARDTASFTLKAHGKTAEIMDWLHEFLGKVPDGAGGTRLCWDLMPADWTAQPELLHDIAKRCHEGGIHVMLESCGHANYEMFAPALPYIDAMYFDVKHIDPEIHRQLTGADNRLILENLHKIAAFGVPIIVRTPVIPGYNDSDENIMGIAEMLRSIGRVESYELLAYHKLGESKYHALGRTYPVAEGTEPPSLERMRELVAKANSVLAGSGKTCFYVE